MKKIVIFLNEGSAPSKERGHNYMNGPCSVGDRGLAMSGAHLFFLCLTSSVFCYLFCELAQPLSSSRASPVDSGWRPTGLEVVGYYEWCGCRPLSSRRWEGG